MPTPKKAATKPSKVSTITTVQFAYETETPGAWRLKEEGEKDSAMIGTLYLRKAKFPTKPESGVELTVKVK